ELPASAEHARFVVERHDLRGLAGLREMSGDRALGAAHQRDEDQRGDDGTGAPTDDHGGSSETSEDGGRTPRARRLKIHGQAMNPHGFVAGSQCSAILPSAMRNISNQVVAYFLDGSPGSGCSRTNAIITRSPSAMIATSGALTVASIGDGLLI